MEADLPAIESFTAEPMAVASGGVSTLAWTTTGADRCILVPGWIEVPPSGTLGVTPTRPTVYVLSAVGPGGETSAPVNVIVMPVEIEAFAAVPATVEPGGAVTLEWHTTFASGCSIDQGVGGVPLSGSAVVFPQQTTIYTLSAHGFEPVSRAVTVHVAV